VGIGVVFIIASSSQRFPRLIRMRSENHAYPYWRNVTPASVNDVTVFKEASSGIENRTFDGDKIYFINELNQHMLNHQNSEMLTPVKAVTGMPEVIQYRLKAANDLFSTAVSKVRQPVEAIFNWLIEKADIQKASKVRSTKGIMVHAFGR